MAKVPAEQRGGRSTWLWVVATLAVIGVIWILFELFMAGEPEEGLTYEGTEAVTDVAPEAAEGGVNGIAVTSLATLLNTPDPATLVGQTVQLTGLVADPASGDSTFWISAPGTPQTERVFVVLATPEAAVQEPGAAADNGASVEVAGVVQRVEAGDPEAWGVTGSEAQALQEQAVYIRARQFGDV